MGGLSSYLGHDGLLHDLGHMRPNHNGPDILQLCLVLALVLRQGHQSPIIQVLGDLLWVAEQAEDLASDHLSEAVVWVAGLEDGAIEPIRT